MISNKTMNYSVAHSIGNFIINDKGEIIEEKFATKENNLDDKKIEEEFFSKHKPITPLPADKWSLALTALKDKKYFTLFKEKNIRQTTIDIKNSVHEDQLLGQAIANCNELDRTANLLSKRLREWQGLTLPELGQQIQQHQKYAELIAQHPRLILLQNLHLNEEQTPGAPLADHDLEQIKKLASTTLQLYSLREKEEQYLKNIMEKYCPNILELAGTTIGAKLLELSKGLRNMAMLAGSTIQLLGAEKALFRHLKTGARSPKYGIIYAHPLIQNTKPSHRGKAARALADKLSLCARLDYFKGEQKALAYKKQLEEKFNL